MHAPDRQVVCVRDVPTRLQLGVTAQERAQPQEVFVSITLTLYDPPRFAEKDRLEDTVDYDDLIAFIREGLAARGEIHLIETVADLVAEHALGLSGRIATAEVAVAKPAVLKGAGAVHVSLLRHGGRSAHRHALYLAEDGGARAERLA